MLGNAEVFHLPVVLIVLMSLLLPSEAHTQRDHLNSGICSSKGSPQPDIFLPAILQSMTSSGTCRNALSNTQCAQASLCAKENREGQLLLEAASALPLVLVSDQGAGPECVWRGIEVGAAEVLEKPLSVLKLQNIWQHVVRKVPPCPEAASAKAKLELGDRNAAWKMRRL